MITLDTDVISELLRPRPSPSLVERLAAVTPREQSTTAISIGELAYRTEKARRPELFDRIINLLRGVRVFPFDVPAAAQYGGLRAELERAGTPLPDPDLRIASIALANDLLLVTGNVRHFARVPGLVVENWIR